ncbi:MAG: WD40 repeat domain-containing protein, partial [Planctomycetota bacterium]
KCVAYGGVDRQVYQYSLAEKKEEVISKGQPFWITCLGYSPDGRRIAVGDESCDIWLYEVSSKKRLFHNKHHVECWLNSVAWAPDNETFLFGCRPNSHAGRPHLHMPLTRAEAARSAVARDSRRRLLDEIDAEIAKAKDDKGKTMLKNYRETLAGEEQVQAYSSFSANTVIGLAGGASGGAGFTDAPVLESGGVALPPGGGSAVTAPLKDLPEHLRKLAEAHGKTVQKEMERLQSDFCVNQWKVK